MRHYIPMNVGRREGGKMLMDAVLFWGTHFASARGIIVLDCVFLIICVIS
jgi:hypothetical protein